MPRLRGVDEARRIDLLAVLDAAPLKVGAALGAALPALADVAGQSSAFAATYAAAPDGVVVQALETVRLDAPACRRALHQAVSEPAGAAPLLPLRPLFEDRNRPVAVDLGREALPRRAAELVEALGISSGHALRLCVCDGQDPMACVVLFRSRSFEPRERNLLASIAGPLSARVRMERMAAEAPMAAAALHAALDALGAPAFVLDPGGRIVRLNRQGRALLADEPGVQGELRACAEGRGAGKFTVTRFSPRDGAGHLLAIAKAPGQAMDGRMLAASMQWGLTPRQREVLACVVRGLTNKSIAAELGCAENTVEIHVSALLSKAGCESRVELAARFWSGTQGLSRLAV